MTRLNCTRSALLCLHVVLFSRFCRAQTDAVLTALGVEDREDLDELCSFFYSDEKSMEANVHANDVIKYIKYVIFGLLCVF